MRIWIWSFFLIVLTFVLTALPLTIIHFTNESDWRRLGRKLHFSNIVAAYQTRGDVPALAGRDRTNQLHSTGSIKGRMLLQSEKEVSQTLEARSLAVMAAPCRSMYDDTKPIHVTSH
jgi:hypothetical protein